MSDFQDTDVKKPSWGIQIFDILIGPSFINKYTVIFNRELIATR
jgi:hypothetical protein